MCNNFYIDWNWWYDRYKSICYFLGLLLVAIGITSTFNQFVTVFGLGLILWSFIKAMDNT